MKLRLSVALLALVGLLSSGCAKQRTYHNANMDFGSIKSVAVLPFLNLSQDQLAGERVRDVFMNTLLASGAVYALPIGEVARAGSRTGVVNLATPSTEEVVKLGTLLKVDAVFTGTVKEYGEVRSGSSASANVISISVYMHETTTGKVIWSGSSTLGGIGWAARLLGTAGGDPMNLLTEQAVDEVVAQLFK
jgi:polysaccharide biosynthesis protein PelC